MTTSAIGFNTGFFPAGRNIQWVLALKKATVISFVDNLAVLAIAKQSEDV